jgi:hypothetical protein
MLAVAELPQSGVDERRPSFLMASAEYERARPDYPMEAIEWISDRAGNSW